MVLFLKPVSLKPVVRSSGRRGLLPRRNIKSWLRLRESPVLEPRFDVGDK